jgi:hypothetical protein
MMDLIRQHEAAFDLIAKLHSKAIEEHRPGYYPELLEKSRTIERVRRMESRPPRCLECGGIVGSYSMECNSGHHTRSA